MIQLDNLKSADLLKFALEQNINMAVRIESKGENDPTKILNLQENFSEAAASLEKVLNPNTMIVKISHEHTGENLILDNDIVISSRHIQKSILPDTEMNLYGLTLGYDSDELLRLSDFDYALSHFQFLLSRSMLIELGKIFFNNYKSKFLQFDWKRHAIIDAENCNDKILWSPLQIKNLVQILNKKNFNLIANDEGCLTPTYSIVGIMSKSPKEL